MREKGEKKWVGKRARGKEGGKRSPQKDATWKSKQNKTGLRGGKFRRGNHEPLRWLSAGSLTTFTSGRHCDFWFLVKVGEINSREIL